MIEALALIVDFFKMLFDVLGKTFLVLFLTINELTIKFIAANLIDGDLIHFSKVIIHFAVDPIIEFNQVDVHVIDAFELASG